MAFINLGFNRDLGALGRTRGVLFQRGRGCDAKTNEWHHEICHRGPRCWNYPYNMALPFNKICLRAFLVLSVSLNSAFAKVVAPVRIELTMVHLKERADRPADLSGFVKAPKDGVVGVMSLAKAQALLSKAPVRDSLELGTVQLSSGQATVVEKMHQVDVGKKSRSEGVRVGVKSTHTSTGAVGLELKPEIISWEGAESEAATGQTTPSVRNPRAA